MLKRTPEQDDFYHLLNGGFCGEARDAVSRCVCTAGQSCVRGSTKAAEGLMFPFRKTIVPLNTTEAVVVLIPGLHARDDILKPMPWNRLSR